MCSNSSSNAGIALFWPLKYSNLNLFAHKYLLQEHMKWESESEWLVDRYGRTFCKQFNDFFSRKKKLLPSFFMSWKKSSFLKKKSRRVQSRYSLTISTIIIYTIGIPYQSFILPMLASALSLANFVWVFQCTHLLTHTQAETSSPENQHGL